ncbi:MAG: HNH endonuclease [SAR324 cluster bacterium]|nr:HNH endonuclease [SAR324 cluster bacterium]
MKANNNQHDFFIPADQDEIAREKRKAQTLRKSQWWKNRRACNRCYYCKKTFPAKSLTMDHLIPLVRGGKSTKGNIVPCCKECNNHKKYLLPVEWEEYLEGLQQNIR